MADGIVDVCPLEMGTPGTCFVDYPLGPLGVAKVGGVSTVVVVVEVPYPGMGMLLRRKRELLGHIHIYA